MVTLGPTNQTWRALYFKLAALAVSCGAEFAFVVDTTGFTWCVGIPKKRPNTTSREQNALVRHFVERELRRRTEPRAGQVIVLREEDVDRCIALRFANLYVVGVWFSDSAASASVQIELRRSVRVLRALLSGLQPNPRPTAGAAKLRSA